MASEIHVNDIGTKFLVTIKDDGSIVDVSNASVILVKIRKPDDVVLAQNGILDSDGTDGKIYYTTQAGDLDQAGTYKLQVTVHLPAGTYYTDIYTFKVHCNL